MWFSDLVSWSQQNFYLYFAILVGIKILGGVWPPLPGGLFTVGSIPVIGWFWAYLADVIGALIGSSISFYLGKKYGWKLLERLFAKEKIEKFKRTKIKKHRELEAMIVLRVFYGAVGEIISYGAGLIGVSFRNFILGLFGWSILAAPIFYISQNIFSGRDLALNIGILVVGILLFVRFKRRYFE